MRLGLLTQWYDPEPGPAALPGVLARGLRHRGHDVQVLTAFPNYPTGQIAPGYTLRPQQDERLDDIDVRRVAVYPNHDASAARRFLNYASFGISAATLGFGALRGLDALWVNYSPITVAWPMWAARFALGVPAVVHVLDLWPDTVLAGGFDGLAYRVMARPLRAWCRGMYRTASSVAYISPGVGPVLQERGVPADKLHYIPMWADEKIFRESCDDFRRQLGISDDQIVLLYAGTLGEAQGLTSLIDACAQVTDPRFVALIAGSGITEGSLRERADRLESRNVRFLGRFAQTQMTRLISTADISYIGLRPHALSAVTMPSKTQAALAAGRSTLIAAEGDVARVGADSGAAFCVHPDDSDAIAQAIEQACALGRQGLAERGRKGRLYYERTFSTLRGVEEIEQLLLDAAAQRTRVMKRAPRRATA